MSDTENCIELLKKIEKENYFAQKTIDGFWWAFSNYRLEDPTEYRNIFGDEDATVNLDDMRFSLVLHEQPLDFHAYFTVYFNIYFKNKQIGYYKMIFSLDGGVDDDVLYFD